MCVAYPTYPSVCFTANNVGLPDELMGLEGHTVVVKMKEKGGKLDVQQALCMKYTNHCVGTHPAAKTLQSAAETALSKSR